MFCSIILIPLYSELTTHIIASNTPRGKESGLDTYQFQFLKRTSFCCKQSIINKICSKKFTNQYVDFHYFEEMIKNELDFMSVTGFWKIENGIDTKSAEILQELHQ